MNTTVKRLRALTIIPESLYVRRAADAQLRAVVENMGRPGYVLVARQMGKTNLLLNARRELGNDGDVFLYIDLSNRFPTLEQFFRNIIDTAVEVYSDMFENIRSKISEIRLRNTGLPAHKEHEQELRLLLNNVQDQKIIICLDEIDALTKSPYSDSVFSLIRSTYFSSRVNFNEFNRLTYILSGVAEPSEIIKNKDISPFNIGEKIYLDDFSFEEYLNFLEKAHLDISEKVANRIYYWTSGNPRMCWDTCSAIEDLIRDGVEISDETVDLTVRKLYLTTFDMAPVDHIRQLVEDDKEIRTAIINIHYDKFSSVNDLQRTKLYLAGVVKANFLSGTVSIKNKIIEESLSIEWINSVEERKLSLRDRADAKLVTFDYAGALELYKECESSISSKEKIFLYHSMGECSIRLGDFESAIVYLTKSPARKSSFATLFFRQQLWLATALLRTGDSPGSIARLNFVIDSDFGEGYPYEYYEALVNRCAPYFDDLETNCSQIIQDCRIVIDGIDSVLNISTEQSNTLKCAAFLNIAVALRKTSRHAEAVEVLNESLTAALDASKPTLMVELHDAVPEVQRDQVLLAAAELINSGRFSFKNDLLTEQFNFTPLIYADLIVRASNTNSLEVWNALISPLVHLKYGENATLEVFNLALLQALRLETSVAVYRILKQLLYAKCDLVVEQLQAVFYYVFIVENHPNSSELEDVYLQFVSDWDPTLLSARDFVILYMLGERNLIVENIPKASKIVGLAKSKRSALVNFTDIDFNCAFAALDFLDIQILAINRNFSSVVTKARNLHNAIEKIVVVPALFDGNFFSSMRLELDRILGIRSPSIQVRVGKKYGRNDKVRCRFSNGEIREGKYKIFTQQLAEGICTIEGD
jgi:tetratricopeptide (TPR) repeat protein